MELTAERLASLEAEDLAEELVRLAQRVRHSVQEGSLTAPLAALQVLEEAASRLKGPRLALVEVAAATLKALSRSEMSSRELALRRFFEEFPEGAAQALEMLSSGSAGSSFLQVQEQRIRTALGHLKEMGILREAAGRIDVAPQFMTLVRDLLEPSPFRTWREVESARQEIRYRGLKEADAASYYAAQFGVDREAALRFAKRMRSVVPAGKATLYEKPRYVAKNRGVPKAPETSAPEVPRAGQTNSPSSLYQPFPEENRANVDIGDRFADLARPPSA